MTPMISDRLVNAYQSQRLHYIRIEKDDEHFRSYLKEHMKDPVDHILASSTLIRPQGNLELNYLMGEFSSALLGVAICLLPSEEDKKDADSDEAKGKDGEKKPTIIGDIVLGAGGMPGSIAHNRCSSIGLSLMRDYQNKGYGREAINWMLDWGFRHAGLHSIQLSTGSFNTRAAHVYESMGFVQEGRRRECYWFDRKWYDDIEFGMTEKDWERIRGISDA